jgi:hypothetical protein
MVLYVLNCYVHVTLDSGGRRQREITPVSWRFNISHIGVYYFYQIPIYDLEKYLLKHLVFTSHISTLSFYLCQFEQSNGEVIILQGNGRLSDIPSTDWTMYVLANIPDHRATIIDLGPVKIWVKIGNQHPFTCRKRRLNGGDLSNETEKSDCPVLHQVWHDKDPSLLNGPECRALA